MKIAIIADALDNQYAGIHVYTREIILAINRIRKNHELIVIREKQGDLPQNIQQIEIPVLSGPLGQIIRLSLQIPAAIRRMNADVVIEPRHVGPFNLPNTTTRVTVIHDLSWKSVPEFQPFFSAMLQRTVIPWVLKSTNLIVTNSHWTAHDLAQQFPAYANKIIPAPLGPPQNLAIQNDEGIHSALGIDSPFFLFVSTLEPRKNLRTLLAAYQGFRQKNESKVQLVLAGKEGWKMKGFQQAMAQHPFKDDIVQTGFISNQQLAALYKKAIAFVYPSWYEGFGLPILEAFSYGTPVITSNTTAMPEVAGNAAILADPADAKTFTEAMHNIWGNPQLRQTLSTHGLRRVREFSWEKTAATILSALEEKANKS
ncbi:MAG: glycosyltransferase family 4 protein [Saprospiraceae bacterium]|nr:glycosyltransferase family 4 protein [Saprospiraceae bacterium]